MRNLFLIFLAIAVSHFGARPAKAQGHPVYMTFDVPIKLESLPPEVKKFGIQCAACEGDQCESLSDGHYHTFGTAEHDLGTAPGPHSFDGTVSVPVTAHLNSEHHKLRTYSCHLYLKSASFACNIGSSFYHVDDAAVPSDPGCQPWAQPQPGAAFVAHLYGDLAIDVLPPSVSQIPSGGQASPKPILPPSLDNSISKPVIVGPVPHKK